MKLKNGEVFAAREPLQNLMSVKLPVKASYNVAKLANKLNEQLKVIDDVRNGLIKKYGEEKDGQIIVAQDSENFVKFAEEIGELMEKEEKLFFEAITTKFRLA